jgi:2-hydroxychromene-2-carboxylate isomerase
MASSFLTRHTEWAVATGPKAIFYYDLGSPESYLAAERVSAVLPVVPEWEPVLAAELGAGDSQHDRQLIERLAAERGLQPLRWPARWPPDSRLAMLAATYAKGVGRVVAFSLAAFRQAFAAGRDLSDPNTVLIAAAACELHPTALLKAFELRSVRHALEQATVRARAAGLRSLPAVQVGDSVFVGDRRLDDAAAALRAALQSGGGRDAAADGEGGRHAAADGEGGR